MTVAYIVTIAPCQVSLTDDARVVIVNSDRLLVNRLSKCIIKTQNLLYGANAK